MSASFLSPVPIVALIAAGSLHAAVEQWTIRGELNYRHPALAAGFSVGDPFTITLDIDTSTGVQPGDRQFYTSTGSMPEAIRGGSLRVGTYSATLGRPETGGFNLVNAVTDAPFGYDQLNLLFATFDQSLTGPPVAGFDVENLALNFTDEQAPFDMLVGTGAAFPAVDAPFPGEGTFDWTRSTNPTYHLRLQFSGGTPSGVQFVRGTVTSLVIGSGGGDGPGGFAQAMKDAQLEGDLAGPGADPNGDGIPNAIAYALGIPLTGDPGLLRNRLPRIESGRLVFSLPETVPSDALYRVLAAADPLGLWETQAERSAGGQWTGATEAPAADGVRQVSIDLGPWINLAARFFRIEVELVP